MSLEAAIKNMFEDAHDQALWEVTENRSEEGNDKWPGGSPLRMPEQNVRDLPFMKSDGVMNIPVGSGNNEGYFQIDNDVIKDPAFNRKLFLFNKLKNQN